MYTKPSNHYSDKSRTNHSARNQIGRKFSKIFDVLMDRNYYTGTKYGKYFDRLNSDGTSKIYVYDSLEEELKKVHYSEKDEIKYLVGLTGMGKTTLLRNYFKIIDRDVEINGNDIVIYISLYYADLLTDSPQVSVKNEIIKYLSRTTRKLLEEHKIIAEDKESFWDGFYNFILNNKPTLLENEKILPDSDLLDEIFENDSYRRRKRKLEAIFESNTLEYYSSLIKYILTCTDSSYRIILIYDDIESKEEKFHKPTVELARHIHSCFSAIENKKITTKTIVSLRAYTFRCNIGRQSQARRESILNDTILKKSAVSLSDIFAKRFAEIEEIQKTKSATKNMEGYNEAKRELNRVSWTLDRLGGQLIYKLSNYNLCDALYIYCNIMVNLEWITDEERENDGAFQLDSKNYRITTENLMYVIANVENDGVVEKSGYVPNILYNDKEGTDLIGMYIIRHLMLKGIDNVYGEKYIKGSDLLLNIRNLFVKRTDSNIRVEYWNYRINDVLNHLYNSGVLFRSLYDIEDPDDYQIERKYDEDFKLYLSPRGKCLFELFSKNAVLLEIYRDDIYTDIVNNDKLTDDLTTTEVFDYLLDYLGSLFEFEKGKIGSAIPDLSLYQEILGDVFMTSILLEGVVNNMAVYFKSKDNTYADLLCKTKNIFDNMSIYSESLRKKYNIDFYVVDGLSEAIDSL